MKFKIGFYLLPVMLWISCSPQGSDEARPLAEQKLILPGNIWQVFQDSRGHYWFGSNGSGAYCYDGAMLRQITAADGLTDNSIRGFQEDKAGNVFIETPNGVTRYDGSIYTVLNVERSSNDAWKLEPDDLWFNCNGNANHVYRYDGENLVELKLPKQDLQGKLGLDPNGRFNPYTIYGINKDQAGNMWFGTLSAGAFRFDGNSFLWVGEQELSTLPDGRVPGVRAMLQDRDGYFWLSNFVSKYRIDSILPLGYEQINVAHLFREIAPDELPYFNSGLVDREGNLWMIIYGGAVWKYDGTTLSKTEVRNGSQEVLLLSIYEDRDGVLWLCTDNDGVYRQEGEGFKKFQPN